MYNDIEMQIDNMIKTLSDNVLQLKDFSSRSIGIGYLIKMLEKEKNIPECVDVESLPHHSY